MSAALQLLAAERPLERLAGDLRLFGQFVGSWDVESTVWDVDGGARRSPAEWHFAWVLGGTAIQDLLFERDAPPERRGTTLRAYDERTGLWHVTWVSPGNGQFVHLVARPTPEGILIEGQTADGTSRERWTFSDITPESFTWQGRCSLDDGASWRLQQEMRARRR